MRPMIAALLEAYAACGSPAVVEPSTEPMLTMLEPGCHHAPARLRHPVGAVEVDVDHLAELLRRLARGGIGGADPGVVDEHVDLAQRAHGLLDHARAVLGLGDVGGDGDAAAAERLDVALGLLEPLRAAGADRDVGAGLGEPGGERGAEPGRGAGDDGDLAVEAEAVEQRSRRLPLDHARDSAMIRGRVDLARPRSARAACAPSRDGSRACRAGSSSAADARAGRPGCRRCRSGRRRAAARRARRARSRR